MASPTVVTTPCKVNLHLGVHREKDARGYHRVDSVMVPVGLFDVVSVEDAPSLEVAFDPPLGIEPQRSGVWRAASMLAEELGTRPSVRVSVRAPSPGRAGLGGSSADAGATLRALAARWGVDALDERVVSVARRVGADVAFFLDPTPSLCTPSTCAAAIFPASSGSSEKYSKLRPAVGLRLMFAPGPNNT